MVAPGNKQITVEKEAFSGLRLLEGLLNTDYKTIVTRLVREELIREVGEEGLRRIATRNKWAGAIVGEEGLDQPSEQ